MNYTHNQLRKAAADILLEGAKEEADRKAVAKAKSDARIQASHDAELERKQKRASLTGPAVKVKAEDIELEEAADRPWDSAMKKLTGGTTAQDKKIISKMDAKDIQNLAKWYGSSTGFMMTSAYGNGPTAKAMLKAIDARGKELSIDIKIDSDVYKKVFESVEDTLDEAQLIIDRILPRPVRGKIDDSIDYLVDKFDPDAILARDVMKALGNGWATEFKDASKAIAKVSDIWESIKKDIVS